MPVATDGSESCKGAEQEAIRLAKICSRKLLALSVVVTNREYEDALPWVVEAAEREVRAHLESVKERAAGEGMDCEIVVHPGEEPYWDIVEEAKKNGADLISVGTHAKTGIKRLLTRRLTARAMGRSPCSVLAVPRGSQINYEHIPLATDGCKHSAVAFAKVLAIARQCNSTLSLVTVTPPNAPPAELSKAESLVSRPFEIGYGL